MKHLVIFLFTLVITHSLKGQEYKPFDFDSGRWYCMYSKKGGMFGGGTPSNYYATDSVKFYCDGDTIINSVSFKKLMYTGNTQSMFVPLTAISGYYGAIRNDTLGKKVYFVSEVYDSSYQGTGDLLYDFDLTIGDSIHTTCNLLLKEAVTQIDSVLYCNEYHKRYTTSSGYYIVEGIGSKNGFIPYNCNTGYGWNLCYKEFGNQLCNACNFTLSIDPISPDYLDIFPNPANGDLQIISDLDIRYIELVDLNGVLLQRIDNYDNEIIKLNKKGYYLVKIHTGSGVHIRKVINE